MSDKQYAALCGDRSDAAAIHTFYELLEQEGVAVREGDELLPDTAAVLVFLSAEARTSGEAVAAIREAKERGLNFVPVDLDGTAKSVEDELTGLLGKKEIVYAGSLSPEAAVRKMVYSLPTSVKYNRPDETETGSPAVRGKALGHCPVCGSYVRKTSAGEYLCEAEDCDFSIVADCPVSDPVDPDSLLTSRVRLTDEEIRDLLHGTPVRKPLKTAEGRSFQADLLFADTGDGTLTVYADDRKFSLFKRFRRRK